MLKLRQPVFLVNAAHATRLGWRDGGTVICDKLVAQGAYADAKYIGRPGAVAATPRERGDNEIALDISKLTPDMRLNVEGRSFAAQLLNHKRGLEFSC